MPHRSVATACRGTAVALSSDYGCARSTRQGTPVLVRPYTSVSKVAAAGGGNGRTGQQIPRLGDWTTVPVAAAAVAAATLAYATFGAERGTNTVDPASDSTVGEGNGARGSGVSDKKKVLQREISPRRGGGGVFGNAWPARAEGARADEASGDTKDEMKSTMNG